MGSSDSKIDVAGRTFVRGRVCGKGAFGKLCFTLVSGLLIAAQVYIMRCKKTSKNFVFKELSKAEILSRSAEGIDVLLNERRILTAISGGTYLCPCYGAYQDLNFLYLILEFCSGGELEFHLKKSGAFPEDQLRIYLAQIVSAVNELHTKFGIVHRDLKLQNCLIDTDGFISIIDFGVATELPEGTDIVPNPGGRVIGTLPYMSPEMLGGKDHNVKTDWWSVGVIAYEMAHGKRPFQSGRNTVEQGIFNQSVPNFRCSAELKSLIEGLMTENEEKRFGYDSISAHPFFADINWEDVKNKKTCANFKPKSNEAYFLQLNNMNEVLLGGNSNNAGTNGAAKKKGGKTITDEDQKLFSEWDWMSDYFKQF